MPGAEEEGGAPDRPDADPLKEFLDRFDRMEPGEGDAEKSLAAVLRAFAVMEDSVKEFERPELLELSMIRTVGPWRKLTEIYWDNLKHVDRKLGEDIKELYEHTADALGSVYRMEKEKSLLGRLKKKIGGMF